MKKMSKYARERLQYKNKPRKILSLEERVQALRMFDQTPVYQRVATAFGCSWEQIKNVVLSREEILTYYARCQTVMPNEHPNQVRKKKIIFLGNAIFEYIRRSVYHQSANLDEDSVRARALEFRDAIEIDQFYPNSAWLDDFKRVFNIELPNPENIVVTQTPAESLNCQDIIKYCRDEIQQLLAASNKKKFKSSSSCEKFNENGVSSTSACAEPNETSCNDDEEDDDAPVEDEEGLTIDFSHYEYNDTPPAITVSASVSENSQNVVDSSSMWPKRIKQERRSSSPQVTPKTQFQKSHKKLDIKPPIAAPMANTYTNSTKSIVPQILSSKSALAHLIPLQDYALGEEDFVAMNLLASLAEHYRRDIKRHTTDTDTH